MEANITIINKLIEKYKKSIDTLNQKSKQLSDLENIEELKKNNDEIIKTGNRINALTSLITENKTLKEQCTNNYNILNKQLEECNKKSQNTQKNIISSASNVNNQTKQLYSNEKLNELDSIINNSPCFTNDLQKIEPLKEFIQHYREINNIVNNTPTNINTFGGKSKKHKQKQKRKTRRHRKN